MEKRGRGGRVASTVLVGALLGLAPAVAPTPAAAQESDRDCRCVDAAGQAIENCTCFRTPTFEAARAWTFTGRRARIGVSVDPASPGADEGRGVRLESVVEGSPADDAGLRAGDIVTRVAGRSVVEALEDADVEAGLDPDEPLPVQRFVALVGDLEPGEEAEIEYLRDGEPRRTTVTPERSGWSFLRSGDGANFRVLGEGDGPGRGFFLNPDGLRIWGRDGDAEGHRLLIRSMDPCFSSAGSDRIVLVGGFRCVDGLHLQALNPQLAEYFGVGEGVLVTEVEEYATLEVLAGDVIVAVGGRDVTEPSDVRRILSSYEEDEPVELTVVRRGARTQVRGTRR